MMKQHSVHQLRQLRQSALSFWSGLHAEPPPARFRTRSHVYARREDTPRASREHADIISLCDSKLKLIIVLKRAWVT
jgi:hypothetical protein